MLQQRLLGHHVFIEVDQSFATFDGQLCSFSEFGRLHDDVLLLSFGGELRLPNHLLPGLCLIV